MKKNVGMNAVIRSKGRWMAPPQVPIVGAFWTWWDSTLVCAGGQLQFWQRNIAHSEPGMMETISSQALPVFVITHLKEIEATGRAKVVDEVVLFNKMVWDSCPSIMLSIGPSDPAHVAGTRNAIVTQSENKIEEGVGRHKPYVAYADVNDPYKEVERRPFDQWPCAFQTEDVSGILAEPRDDPDNPPSWTIAEGVSMQRRVRQQLDSVVDDPRLKLTDLPQVAATIGALVAIMQNNRWSRLPLRRKPGDAEDPHYDALYDQISTHR